MSLSRDEHIEQAELMLQEIIQDLAQAARQDEFRRIEIRVEIAKLHVGLADTKRVSM